MAADQPNRGFFTYVDGNGQSWNKMGKIDAACNAIDGSTAAVGGQEDYPAASRRRHVRQAVYTDPTTFRTARCIIYTNAAFTALVTGATLAVSVPGETTAVTYTLSQKIPDKAPIASASRHLIDHV